MQKYKICPLCKTKNDPTLLECIHCETDLTRVKVTDEETEKMLAENSSNATVSQERKMVRLCDCGNKNPANARKCSACGEDISDIIPTPDSSVNAKESTTPQTYILSSIDGQYAYKLTNKETIIGREHTMKEYLISKSYVSRSHAKISIHNDMLYIENISKTNFTFINNKKIHGKVKLSDGDELALGGMNINGQRQSEAAYFLVRIYKCI